MHWYLDAFRHYAHFTGRSSRTAFWTFFLVNLMVSLAIIGFELYTDNPGWLDLVYSLLTLLPCLALAVRRLRDTGLSLYWFALILLPGLGLLVLLVLMTLPSASVRLGDQA